jgi:hypothetical protein
MSIRRLFAVLAAAMAMTAVAASPAAAQTQQEGLVNVAIEDVIVQLPISVAANVCDVNVAVLAEVADDAAACEATATSTATSGPSSDSPIRQEGLVNVVLDDILIQAPISVAANICDVNVAVLAQLDDEAEACEATAESAASRGPGGGAGGGGGDTGPIGIAIPIDIDIGTDGGPTNLVDVGDLLDPANPGGLTFLSELV